ncbi:MAG: class I SAM-dependent methyltransferase [Gemmataceae bacterium]|nr:class I SAM-dependent methyltransferase [Gemmataceae bacterium]
MPGAALDTTIAPDDVMFDRSLAPDLALEHYLRCGRSAMKIIRAALASADVPDADIRRILDLPCGHGRILRHLKAAFPHAQLAACDLERPGVDFCAAQFGATPVYSHPDPDRIPLAGPFDLIWCGSLMTHLDAPRWSAFLRRFRSWLSETGVCVFTSHGIGSEELLRNGQTTYGLPQAQRLLRPYRRRGFAYEPYARGQDYGISMAGIGWIAERIAELPDARIVSVTEKAWDHHHDAIAFGPRFAERAARRAA